MRLSKVEECIFCESMPCECSGTKKPKPRPKKAPEQEKETPPSVPVVRAGVMSMRDKMKAAAAAAPPAPVKSPFDRSMPKVCGEPAGSTDSAAPPQSPPDPTPDTVLAMAIRNLAPILHEDEREKHDVIVGSQPTMSDRAAFWRAQQGDSNGSVT